MRILGIDYETHYEGRYSLKYVPTAQYCRDSRFRLLGCAFGAFSPHYTHWHPGGLSPEYQRDALPGAALVAHNAQFDGAVLERQTGGAYRPALWLDTMLLARYHIAQGLLPPTLRTNLGTLAEHYGLPGKGDTRAAVDAGGAALAQYAEHDLWLTFELLRLLLPAVPDVELRLMDLHVRMATEPVLDLDRAALQEELDEATLPTELLKIVNSADQYAELLRAKGVEPPTKPGKRGPVYAFAKTDRFMQDLAKHADPLVRRLAEARLAGRSSIRRTRAQRFMDIGAPVPVPLLYYGAHTGRSSGLDSLNMQNLPRGGALRRSLRAPEGHTLIICDSRQGEVVTLAWLAQDATLLRTVRESFEGAGPDIYTDFAASVMFHCPISEVTKEQRRLAKPPMLASGFGQGPVGLVAYAERMGVTLSPALAERAVRGYRDRFAAVPRLWKRLEREVQQTGEIVLPSGRKLTYPDCRWEGRDLYYTKAQIFSKRATREDVKLWHGLLTENTVQATHRDIVFWQVLQLAESWKVCLLAHDEVVLCVPEDQAEAALADALYWFSQVPDWAEGCPMAGEAIISKDYGEKP